MLGIGGREFSLDRNRSITHNFNQGIYDAIKEHL